MPYNPFKLGFGADAIGGVPWKSPFAPAKDPYFKGVYDKWSNPANHTLPAPTGFGLGPMATMKMLGTGNAQTMLNAPHKDPFFKGTYDKWSDPATHTGAPRNIFANLNSFGTFPTTQGVPGFSGIYGGGGNQQMNWLQQIRKLLGF